MPAGLPRIEVRFQIDANGILSVAARELRTGIEQAIEVKPSYGLTDQEVERMLIESFEHAEADFEARLLIDARNEAETVIQATEKVLRRSDFAAIAAEQLEAGERERIDAALAALKAVIAGSDRTVDPGEDARAQSRDAAPCRSDDEPDRAGSAGRQECKGCLMPKVTFIKDGKTTTVDFEKGKLPYEHHGLPESFLDVAMNFNIPLEHACGGSCACTTCHLYHPGRRGKPERAGGQGARSARHRMGSPDELASWLPGCYQAATSLSSSRCIPAITYRKAAPFSSANPIPRGGEEAGGGTAVNWTDAEDIGIALSEKFPEIDPLTVRFTDLREKVLAARWVYDDPKASNEPKLEAIQMAWYEEWKENQ